MGNPLIEKPPNQVILASFPEDLDLSELTTSIVIQQIADAVMEGGDEDPNTTPLPSSPTSNNYCNDNRHSYTRPASY
jgi:hypothetical protein